MAEGREIVISDFHHSSLYLSLMYLFQKRLGFDLRRPYGEDWWDEGYYGYDNEDFGRGTLQSASRVTEEDPDRVMSSTELLGKEITLEEAKDRSKEIRYMVASLHQTDEKFDAFIGRHCPTETVLLRQVGNPNEAVRNTRHALCSDKITYDRLDPNEYHKILYHQEFNRHIFEFRPLVGVYARKKKKLKSFLNFIQSNAPIYAQFCGLRNELWDFEVLEHGLQGADGQYTTYPGIADSMADADAVISMKHWDGFGHMIHNAAAIGRPVICRRGDYTGKIAECLLEDGVTALILTGIVEDDAKKIRAFFGDPDTFVNGCWEIYKKFRLHVNFDEEEIAIRKWLEEI